MALGFIICTYIYMYISIYIYIEISRWLDVRMAEIALHFQSNTYGSLHPSGNSHLWVSEKPFLTSEKNAGDVLSEPNHSTYWHKLMVGNS